MRRVVRVLVFVGLLFAATGAALAEEPAASPPDAAKLVELLKAKDRAVRLDAVRAARDVQDEKVGAALAALLDDEDAAVRDAAIGALAQRTGSDAMKKASAALGAHLGKLAKRTGADTEVIATADALGALGQPSTLDALLSDIELGTPVDVVRARLMAAANVPAAAAVEGLINFLAKQGRGQMGPQRQACRAALKSATGEDLGADPDAWRAWWKDAKKTFDFDAAARRRASDKAEQEAKEKRRKGKQDK